MAYWKRNLIVICFAQLLTLIGFSAYLPFIPYYMQELGATSYREAAGWQAIFETGSATAMMVAGPLWGTLADRHGRRIMLIRATLAGAVLAFMLSLAQSPLQLVIIRTLQGAFCGTVSAAITLVATETPEANLGVALGMMQTVQFGAHATGPVVGGVLADTFGYRAVFPISSAMMAVALMVIVLLVRERFEAPAAEPAVRGPRAETSWPQARLRAWRSVLTRNAAILLITLGCLRFGVAVVAPIMSLYVKSLTTDHTRIATLAGAVVSVSGFTSAVAALAIGRTADRLGQKRVLLVCGIGAALMYFPQSLVSSPMQLLMVRAVQGIFMGGTMPTANALLAKSTPAARRGTIFGLSTSVQAGGRALGPMVGAAVTNLWGMAPVFVVTGGIFAVVSAMIGLFVRGESPTVAPEAQTVPVGETASGA